MSLRDELVQVAAEAIAKAWTDDVLQNVLAEWGTQEPHTPRKLLDVLVEEVGKACREVLETQQKSTDNEGERVD